MATPDTGTGELSPQKSPEEVCREAAQKLNEYHTATQEEQRQQYGNELKQETTSYPPLPNVLVEPPPYNTSVVNTPTQIPLERGDGTLSFHVPPPPPPSPGDALDQNPSAPSLPPYHDYQQQVTYPISQLPVAPPVPPYTVVAAPPPQIVCILQPQPQSTPAPAPAPSQTNTNANQNVNNVNVVVENNIGLERHYPSYIWFSVAMLLLCVWLEPLALVCVIPALIFSCVGCCTDRYRTSKVAGQCALCWNIVALVFGITSFLLLIVPAIIVSLLLTVFIAAL